MSKYSKLAVKSVRNMIAVNNMSAEKVAMGSGVNKATISKYLFNRGRQPFRFLKKSQSF